MEVKEYFCYGDYVESTKILRSVVFYDEENCYQFALSGDPIRHVNTISFPNGTDIYSSPALVKIAMAESEVTQLVDYLYYNLVERDGARGNNKLPFTMTMSENFRAQKVIEVLSAKHNFIE